MDERLRQLTRAAATDPEAVGRAVVELCRAGEHAAAGSMVHERLAGGWPVPSEGLDALSPESIDAFTAHELETGRREALSETAWSKDEASLYLIEGDHRGTLVSWNLEAEPAVMVTTQQAYDARPEVVSTVTWPQSLALDPAGKRLALSFRCGYKPRRSVTEARMWCVVDLVEREIEVTAVCLTGHLTNASYGSRLLGSGEKGAVVWDSTEGGDSSPLFKESEGWCALGTCLGRSKRKLSFYRPLQTEPYHRMDWPVPWPKSGWKGVVPVWGGRVLFCDRQSKRLVLLDATGELSGADLPEPKGQLVGVRPCASGWVVALRYKQKKAIDLVDLRTNEARSITLSQWPRDIAWSPSGRSVALPGLKGVMQLLSTSSR